MLFAGMAKSTWRSGESESQKAMTGMLAKDASRMGWWSTRGSVTISSRGSRYCLVIWLVKVPGVYRPAMACSARWGGRRETGVVAATAYALAKRRGAQHLQQRGAAPRTWQPV